MDMAVILFNGVESFEHEDANLTYVKRLKVNLRSSFEQTDLESSMLYTGFIQARPSNSRTFQGPTS